MTAQQNKAVKAQHIFPFFWVRADETDKLAAEVGRVADSGLKAFCVESRVHEDFCGPRWWTDMDIIMAEAKRLGLQVWLLDEISYPTGYAVGAIEKSKRHLRARHIKAVNIDVVGPVFGAKIPLNVKADDNADGDGERAHGAVIPTALGETAGDRVVGAYLFRRGRKGIVYNSAIDVTADIRGRYIYRDIPDGAWRFTVFVSTFSGRERPYFVDMLQGRSVDALIDAVYEPHYARYKHEFGKTFVGFFSDEPRFANGAASPLAKSINAYQNTLGNPGMAYPYSDEVGKLVTGGDPSLLAALWYDIGAPTAEIRVRYMNAITDMYGQNFSGRLGDWCRRRGVLYAGHIIEDMGAHTRTGCSAGHYFKSQRGADFGAVDIVLHQIKPYNNEFPSAAPIEGGVADPAFFNYTLNKLASSAAHIDPQKGGKALCELFGAYGWGETVKDMRWLINHCLARGINHFIPHAFSMRREDPDCPPHHTAQGDNPSFYAYKLLWRYAADMCGLFSGGKQVVSAAVLYHAEAEWSGLKYGGVDAVAKILTQNQIDFDIVPEYDLKNIKVNGGVMSLGQSDYKALIAPYYEYLSPDSAAALGALSKTARVVKAGGDIPLNKLPQYLFNNGCYDARLKKPAKDLRVMHYVKGGKDFYMLFNEGKKSVANGFVGGADFVIGGGEARVITSLTDIPFAASDAKRKAAATVIRDFDVYTKLTDGSGFEFYKKIDGAFDINAADEKPEFSGFVKYAARVNIKDGDKIFIDFDGEFCRVKIGGAEFSTIDKVSEFDLSGLAGGEYALEIILNNTLAYRVNDFFSGFNYLERCALNEVKIG